MTELHVDDRDGVRTIAIDRPAARNGLTLDAVRAFTAAVRESPDAIRVLVVTGRNGAFCTGLDLKSLTRTADRADDAAATERGMREFHGLIRAVHACERPTIAAVDGVAAGFGCDLALACDLRVISDRAVFGELFVRRGLMPDGGGTWTLPRIVGLGRALDLMLTGDTVDAAEAMRIGLATRLVASPAYAAYVDELAAKLAKGAPLAHRAIKRAVYAGFDGDLEAALAREAAGQLELLASSDFDEGVAAFLDKRPPQFRGR